MPLIACLTATLLSCYSGETDRSRVHLPTEPARFEFYPQYDHNLFQKRAGLDEPAVDRFGAMPLVAQAALIYSDELADLQELEPREKPDTDKRGKSKKVVAEKRGKRTKIVIEPKAELAYAEPETKGNWLAALFNSETQTSVPKVIGIDQSKEGYREVVKAAREHGVPVDLALRVAKQESGGNCSATSHAGAGGVMQVMPKTAAKHGVTRFKNIYDCRTGAQTGVRELKHLLKLADGDIKQTLIGYNCGERCMNGKRKKLPAETVNYVAVISGR